MASGQVLFVFSSCCMLNGVPSLFKDLEGRSMSQVSVAELHSFPFPGLSSLCTDLPEQRVEGRWLQASRLQGQQDQAAHLQPTGLATVQNLVPVYPSPSSLGLVCWPAFSQVGQRVYSSQCRVPAVELLPPRWTTPTVLESPLGRVRGAF